MSRIGLVALSLHDRINAEPRATARERPRLGRSVGGGKRTLSVVRVPERGGKRGPASATTARKILCEPH